MLDQRSRRASNLSWNRQVLALKRESTIKRKVAQTRARTFWIAAID